MSTTTFLLNPPKWPLVKLVTNGILLSERNKPLLKVSPLIVIRINVGHKDISCSRVIYNL